MRIAFSGPEEHRPLYNFDIGRYYLYICIVMSDLLNSIWELLRTVGVYNVLLYLLGAAIAIWFWVPALKECFSEKPAPKPSFHITLQVEDHTSKE